jgi:hypothetical protein
MRNAVKYVMIGVALYIAANAGSNFGGDITAFTNGGANVIGSIEGRSPSGG